jgi:hypothetical protein
MLIAIIQSDDEYGANSVLMLGKKHFRVAVEESFLKIPSGRSRGY